MSNLHQISTMRSIFNVSLKVLNPKMWVFNDGGVPFSKLSDFKDDSLDAALHLDVGHNYYFVRVAGVDVEALKASKNHDVWLKDHSYPQYILGTSLDDKVIEERSVYLNQMDQI